MKKQKYKQCEVCHDSIGYVNWNFNGKLTLDKKETLIVCLDCDQSILNQGFQIMEELKVPEPHILKMGCAVDVNTYQVGLYLKLPLGSKSLLAGKHRRKHARRN